MMSIEIETGMIIDKAEELTFSIGSLFADIMEQVECSG